MNKSCCIYIIIGYFHNETVVPTVIVVIVSDHLFYFSTVPLSLQEI